MPRLASMQAFFLFRDGAPTPLLIGEHDPALVSLAIGVALLSALLALPLAQAARGRHGFSRRELPLAAGALALGGGVWAMHFIAMLAFDLCTPVRYAFGPTLLSIVPAVLGARVGLGLISHPQVPLWRLLLSGSLLAAGIGAMHFIGMSAMQMSALLRYDPLWFAATLILAGLTCVLGLGLEVRLRGANRIPAWLGSTLSAAVIAAAISLIHFVGMASARFVGTPDPDCVADSGASTGMALGIAGVVIVFGLLIGGLHSLSRFRALALRARADEERMRAILDTAVDAILTADSAGRIQNFNRGAERLFGWRAEEVLGRTLRMLIPPALQPRLLAEFQQLLDSGEPRELGEDESLHALTRSGELRPIRLSLGRAAVPGRPLFVAFVRDLSERQALSESLREQELQTRTLIANLPGVAFRCRNDVQWSMLFVSDGIEALTGWSAAAFLKGETSFAAINHPDDEARCRAVVEAALAEDRPWVGLEYRIRRRDGSECWVSETSRGVLDAQGELQWIDGVIFDITENKRRKAEHASLAAAVDRVLALVEFGMDGHIRHANQNFLDLTGYTLGELDGQPHQFLKGPLDAEGEAAERALWQALARGEVVRGHVDMRTRGGRRLWVRLAFNPIMDADGRPSHVVLFCVDLTSLRELESSLRESKERAEQGAAAKSAFLANMSHEIRTPMNAILGFAELLLDTPLQDAQRRHLRTVRNSARSLLGLLNGILDTAKLERGAIEIEDSDYDPRELCEQVTASLRISAERKRLDLQLEWDPGLPRYLRGDPARLQQVLVNLLGNAVKFTEAGTVCLRAYSQGEQLCLSIIDTGIGIEPARLQRIFEPFAQADASITRRFGGTGLGTTIARQLVELMGGHIEVESTLGQGSCFRVVLPLRIGQAPANRDEEALAPLPPLDLLVVDDVAQNLELMLHVLGGMGHRVRTASQGEEALALLADEHFDAVLMDMHMPVLDGLAATRLLREHERLQARPRLPVLALTASVLEEDRRAARAAGMDGFCVKPLEPHALVRELARVLAPAAALVPDPLHLSVPERRHEVVDWVRGVALWGGRSPMLQAAQRFCDEAEAGLALNPVPDLALAHRLHGTAANLGLMDFAALAGSIESALREQPPRNPDSDGAALRAALARIRAELASEDADTAEDALVLANPARAHAALTTLARALDHGELDEQALADLADSLPLTPRRPLLDALEAFDFAAARQAIDTLRAQLDVSEDSHP
jgi:PAS domain S-box-containing protein